MKPGANWHETWDVGTIEAGETWRIKEIRREDRTRREPRQGEAKTRYGENRGSPANL